MSREALKLTDGYWQRIEPLALSEEEFAKVQAQIKRSLDRVGTTEPKSVGPLGMYRFIGRSLDRSNYGNGEERKGNKARNRVQVWQGTAISRLTHSEKPYNLAIFTGNTYGEDRAISLDLDTGQARISQHGLNATHYPTINHQAFFHEMFYPAGDAGGTRYRDTGTPYVPEIEHSES